MEHKRKCIGCGELKPQNELIKIMKEHDSETIVIQPDSNTFGRSVYICYNKDCISMSFKKNRINKVLKTGQNINKNDILNLVPEQ